MSPHQLLKLACGRLKNVAHVEKIGEPKAIHGGPHGYGGGYSTLVTMDSGVVFRVEVTMYSLGIEGG